MVCDAASIGSDLIRLNAYGTKRALPWPILLVVAVVGAACVGCGSSTPADLGKVQGTVTMDGAPLAKAQVVFSPEGGRPSMGVTDEAGKYSLTYIRDVKGAKVGHHSVRIETVPPPTTDQEAGGNFVETIPAKYNVQSTLTADVKAGDNTIDFPLVSK